MRSDSLTEPFCRSELFVIIPFALRKNDVINGCIFGLWFAHEIAEKRFDLFSVVSVNAWQEHILFNVLPERYPSPLEIRSTFPGRFLLDFSNRHQLTGWSST